MAIDTVNKRRSVQAYTLGLMRPVADGVIDAADRAAAAWFYSGTIYSVGGGGAGATRPRMSRIVSPGRMMTR